MDESGANRALCPREGYAPKGQRSHGQAPRSRGRNTSMPAAMSARGLVGTMTVEGSTNTAVFLTYLDRVLCPVLRAGQAVIMDNLSFHKNEAVRAEKTSLRLPPGIPARLQSGLPPHRTRLFQTQAVLTQGQSAHAGNARSGQSGGSDHPHRPRCQWLVQTLRLLTLPSAFLKSAVR